jgi:type I restriction enzyme M protein
MSKTRDHAAMEKRRKKAGRLFAKECSAPDVARRLGVARQVAYRWKKSWEQGGTEALVSKGPAGPKAKLTMEQTQQVTEALLAGPAAHGYKTDLWTLPRVAGLIEDLTGVGYHPGHVWRLLGASGFSCQRPERRAVERDEKAIRRWQRTEWPALKKGPATKANHRLYRRKRAEYVLGLGPNLFYNSPMEACVVICRTAKPKARKNKILLINAVNEVTRERAQSFLTDDHIERIVQAYEPGFTRVATLEEIRAKDGNLSIPLYVAPAANGASDANSAAASQPGLSAALNGWLESAAKTRKSLQSLIIAADD